MTFLKSTLTLLICVLCYSATSQDMQDGFTYLEQGKYAQAESFFADVLVDYPTNKTARLCYGRAIGLNGKTKEAFTLFTDLLADYPEDFEVKLNYGESMLWDKKFEDAQTFYQQLVIEKEDSFPALLGYANTLSNLKVYQEAIVYVDKALAVYPGNPNALTSKKYIYLGYAYQNQQAQKYAEAEVLLLNNLNLFPDDKDTLMNLANLYLIWEKFDQAQQAYEQLDQKEENRHMAQNGLALVAHLMNKEKKALKISKANYENLAPEATKTTKQQVTERYVQALIWNKKYTPAQGMIDELSAQYTNENWVLALRATLNIYRSDFKKSLIDYDTILVNDSTSFDGNLGKANVLKALNRPQEAYESAQNTLVYYQGQKDAVNFVNKLNIAYDPKLETKVAYTFDNGDNKAYLLNTQLEFPLSTRLSLLGEYGYRSTDNAVTNNTATANNLLAGVNYQVQPSWSIKARAGVATASADNNSYAQLLTDVSATIKPMKLQNLEVGYKRQVESFNAELLSRELVQNNFYANYNLSTNFNLGWYTQYIYTTQNDNNRRNLLFTSLYYNILAKPTLKVGFNYQHITFQDQLPTIYFSPEKFNAYELFFNLIQDENAAKPKQFYYNLTVAVGYQYIEDQPKQDTYRVQGAFGYKFSERALLNLYGTRSNIASATAAGFTFTEIGLRFKWTFLDRAMLDQE